MKTCETEMLTGEYVKLKMEKLKQELAGLEAERDAQYWRFCRCARAQPVSGELCRQIGKLENEITDLTHGPGTAERREQERRRRGWL